MQALYDAIVRNDVVAVRALLDSEAFRVNDPLFLATGQPDARYRVPVKRGSATMLHVAAFAGAAAVVRLLLALGADPTAMDAHNLQPISVAANDDVRALLSSSPSPAQSHAPVSWSALIRSSGPLPASGAAPAAAVDRPPTRRSLNFHGEGVDTPPRPSGSPAPRQSWQREGTPASPGTAPAAPRAFSLQLLRAVASATDVTPPSSSKYLAARYAGRSTDVADLVDDDDLAVLASRCGPAVTLRWGCCWRCCWCCCWRSLGC